MDEWIDRFADELGVERLGHKDMGALLRLSREVAHGVERKLAPLSTFVAGTYVGRRLAEGGTRTQAMEEALAAADRLMPESTPEAAPDAPSEP